MDLRELTADRELEQRRIEMYRRQRRSVGVVYEGKAAEDERVRLDACIALSEAMVEDLGNRMIDAALTGSRPTLEPH
jgi:hypothetical protein